MPNKCNLYGLTSAHTFAVKAHKRVKVKEGTELQQAESNGEASGCNPFHLATTGPGETTLALGSALAQRG